MDRDEGPLKTKKSNIVILGDLISCSALCYFYFTVLHFTVVHFILSSCLDYAVEFPNANIADYVIINPANKMPSLTQFTICLWMKSIATGYGTLFSYAVPQAENEIVIWATEKTEI